MILLQCDYLEGAHPKIIENLVKTNLEQTAGYSVDEYTKKAKELIKEFLNNDDVDVHLLVGGTQTNKTVISSILKPYQGVISADTGHIATHETGTIEASGHKVLTIPHTQGKIFAKDIKAVLKAHFDDELREHDVQPGLVYISNPTESGTIYTKQELIDIKAVCSEYNTPLYLDGARMGYALASPKNDILPSDYAKYCDAFYIGGTKVGALFGEAVVIVNDKYKKDFRYFIKQNGGLFAKGRLLGIQFKTLFEDNLYTDISKNAVDLAIKLKEALLSFGVKELFSSYTNQQFFILENDVIKALANKYTFETWQVIDSTYTAVRICTSWATKKEDIDSLIKDFEKVLK